MSKVKNLLLLATFFLIFFSQTTYAQAKHTFGVGKGSFLLDGKPFVIKSAELHYPRIPADYWQHRLRMCKALGMNTVCLYIFWNIHEPRPGEFDFEGQNDVVRFCKLAQKEGLWVIVRPGPYVCAEWEMGGLPWWLLRHEGVTLRDDEDPYFLERVGIFEREIGKRLAPLTIENGGPILMVQVENEYGSYGEDKTYVGKVRDTLRQSGFEHTTLFQCDWSSNFTKNGLDDLVWTLNFGTGADVEAQFKKLRELRPEAPLMCSEYWSGWFDKWGARHETRPAAKMVEGIEQMLSRGISFSLYMTHGGTSFGHWAGANSPGYAPDVTSYDYDAPIDESGHATEKYYTLRKVLSKYANGKLPSVPKAIESVGTDTIWFTEYAPLSAGISKEVDSPTTLTMEDLNTGWGIATYETTLPRIDGRATLEIKDLADYAVVRIDGREVGRGNRIRGLQKIDIGNIEAGQKLSITVEAMGRINFGRAIADRKGITKCVLLSGEIDGHLVSYELRNWHIGIIDDEYTTAQRALTNSTKATGKESGYYRATFDMRKVADTHINCSRLGKGQAYVNGHAVGRYWSIGPQQTLYVPGCWLRKKQNELIIVDVSGIGEAKVWGQRNADVNTLQLDTDSTMAQGNGERPNTKKMTASAETTLKRESGVQAVTFDTEKSGRYIAIEVVDSHDGTPPAIAEIYAVVDGKRIDRNNWKINYVSDENTTDGNNTAAKTIDLQESTYWLTTAQAKQSHIVVVDTGRKQKISGIEIIPRAESGVPGAPRNIKVYVY